jgi:hypothetical protein
MSNSRSDAHVALPVTLNARHFLYRGYLPCTIAVRAFFEIPGIISPVQGLLHFTFAFAPGAGSLNLSLYCTKTPAYFTRRKLHFSPMPMGYLHVAPCRYHVSPYVMPHTHRLPVTGRLGLHITGGPDRRSTLPAEFGAVPQAFPAIGAKFSHDSP